MKPLLIIHGWSDDCNSFLPLADALAAAGRDVDSLYLGDYVSLDDDVRMRDLVAGLSRAWRQKNLPGDPRSVDVIVHSTGGLVIRDWMDTEYVSKGLKPPVHNLVMLAPANFGSPLAHKGRALYGRVIKGFNSRKPLQTGTHILKALEMASPYSWDLAERDRFSDNAMSASGVRTTVLVGNTGYRGISSLANESGSDGTVYVATANLNCASVQIHFPEGDRKPRVTAIRESRGETAFLVKDGFDHSSIALKDPQHPGNAELLQNILEALAITNATDFKSWVAKCQLQTDGVTARHAGSRDEYKHGFQNTVFRVRDNYDFHVCDYVIEFYHDVDSSKDRLAELFNKKALQKVHAYKDDAALRSFMINCSELYRIIEQQGKPLSISLSALPDLNIEENMAGYCSFGNEDIGEMELDAAAVRRFFAPNRTLFVDLTLTRLQKDDLFTIRKRQDASG